MLCNQRSRVCTHVSVLSQKDLVLSDEFYLLESHVQSARIDLDS